MIFTVDYDAVFNYKEIKECINVSDSFDYWEEDLEDQLDSIGAYKYTNDIYDISIRITSIYSDYVTLHIICETDKAYDANETYKVLNNCLEKAIEYYNETIINEIVIAKVPNANVYYVENNFYIELAPGQNTVSVDYIPFRLRDEDMSFEDIFTDAYEYFITTGSNLMD